VTQNKWKKVALTVVLLGATVFLLLFLLGSIARAAGLVDNTVAPDNLYSQYPLDPYQLDFYVDTTWEWLPWNWTDGIGKQVMYGLYTITNFIWMISLYLSNATGYLIQQSYSLDFISETADAIGNNIQILAGITANGFSSTGFYVGFLLLFVLIIGIYVTYTGLMKRETTRAIRAIMNFLVVFILSASFIAYAPSYITKINAFSADISEAALDLGTKILMPSSDSRGKDSVDMIRNNLFAIQVEQPWLLLQFGDSSKETIGENRVNDIVSISPDSNNGKDREEAVKADIETYDNKNLTITKTTNRLGMVFFLFLFNIGISIFVFLLSGIMIFSQILFIIFAMFLPISFLLSMMPTFEGMAKQAILKLFNVIMLRAGITLIITIAFSISSMLYALTTNYPFFLVAFLQLVTFAGIYMKLSDIMSMFSLQSNDSQQVSRKVLNRPYQLLRRNSRKLPRSVGRMLSGKTTKASKTNFIKDTRSQQQANKQQKPTNNEQPLSTAPFGYKAGQMTGKLVDTTNRIRANIQYRKEQLQDLPTTAHYAVVQGKEQFIQPVHQFKRGVTQAKEQRQQTHEERTANHRQSIAQKRRVEEGKHKASAPSTHERPALSDKKIATRQVTPSQMIAPTAKTVLPSKLRRQFAHQLKQEARPMLTNKQVTDHSQHTQSRPPIKLRSQVVQRLKQSSPPRLSNETRTIQQAQPSRPQPRMAMEQQPKAQRVVQPTKPTQPINKAQTMPSMKREEYAPTPRPQTKRKKRLIKQPKRTVQRYRL